MPGVRWGGGPARAGNVRGHRLRCGWYEARRIRCSGGPGPTRHPVGPRWRWVPWTRGRRNVGRRAPRRDDGTTGSAGSGCGAWSQRRQGACASCTRCSGTTGRRETSVTRVWVLRLPRRSRVATGGGWSEMRARSDSASRGEAQRSDRAVRCGRRARTPRSGRVCKRNAAGCERGHPRRRLAGAGSRRGMATEDPSSTRGARRTTGPEISSDESSFPVREAPRWRPAWRGSKGRAGGAKGRCVRQVRVRSRRRGWSGNGSHQTSRETRQTPQKNNTGGIGGRKPRPRKLEHRAENWPVREVMARTRPEDRPRGVA